MIRITVYLGILLLAVSWAATSQENDLHYRVLEGLTKTEARKELHFPGILGYKTIKCDFHMHTIFSDGSVLPKERVNEAWREGLDVIAITDHNTPQPGYIDANYNTSFELAQAAARGKGITVIQGTEFTRSKPVGHLNFLFIEDANPYAQEDLEPKRAVEMAADEGAFVIYNHPGWPDKNSDLFEFQIDLMNRGKIHAIEVVNSKEFYPLAVDYCPEYNLAPLSTTDIHAPIQANYDTEQKFRNLTLVFADDKSEASVKEALFARRTVACAGNLLAGEEKYLNELLRESLMVSDFQTTDSHFSCNVTNQSEVTYFFEGPGHSKIIFPARKTIRLAGEQKKMDVIFEVSNTWVSSREHLELPLHFILAGDEEVSMPFVKQDLKLMNPETPVEVFCPTPGAEIRYTTDGTEPNEGSTLYTGPFKLSTSSPVRLKAFKEGMETSRTFSLQAVLNIPHEGVKLQNPDNGIKYRYYEGVLTSVLEMEDKAQFVSEGVADLPDISKAAVEDHFGMIFSGYIYAPTEGLYTFATQSDDGTTFKIDGIDLIDNDGSHSLTKVSESIPLKKGYHPFELRYMEDYEGQELRFLWTIPGKEEAPVAAEYLFVGE